MHGCPPNDRPGILSNPCYTGQVYSGRYQSHPARTRRSATRPIGRPSDSAMLTSKENWIPVTTVPALISAEMFEQVQAELARNQVMAKRNNKSHDYLFRALVSCGCGEE